MIPLPFPVFALAPARDEDQPPTLHACYALDDGRLVSDAPEGPVAHYALLLTQTVSLAGQRIHPSYATAHAALRDAVESAARAARLLRQSGAEA